MNCQNCGKELPLEGLFCPYCGTAVAEQTAEEVEVLEVTEEVEAAEEVTEEAEATEEAEVTEETEEAAEEMVAAEEAPKKPKVWKWVLAIAGGILLLGALTVAVLYGLGVIDLTPKANDILYKETYVAENAADKADKVVAKQGYMELTNGELQLCYQNYIYSFYNQYYSYMAYMGLDMTKPLSEQSCAIAENMTWEQFFLQAAIDNWSQSALLYQTAKEQGFQMSADLQTLLAELPANMETYASENGFDSAQAYIQDTVGANVSMEDYIQFNDTYYLSNEFVNSFYTDKYPTTEEIETYFETNAETFAASGVTRDMGLQSSVRHLLVSFEGGTQAEDGTTTYSQEEKDATYAKAEELLNQWKAGEATEDSFAALVTEHTDDTASAASGGLYEGINQTSSYVENFLNWSVDSARKPGDTDIVESPYGYHIMYFVSGEDYSLIVIGDQLVADRIQQMLLAAQVAYPLEVNYKNIFLAEMKMA